MSGKDPKTSVQQFSTISEPKLQKSDSNYLCFQFLKEYFCNLPIGLAIFVNESNKRFLKAQKVAQTTTRQTDIAK